MRCVQAVVFPRECFFLIRFLPRGNLILRFKELKVNLSNTWHLAGPAVLFNMTNRIIVKMQAN
jgi:hypothetical protein